MKISLKELKNVIASTLEEAYGTKSTYLKTKEDLEKDRGKSDAKVTPAEWGEGNPLSPGGERRYAGATGGGPLKFKTTTGNEVRHDSDEEFEATVEDMMTKPEFESIDVFKNYKLQLAEEAMEELSELDDEKLASLLQQNPLALDATFSTAELSALARVAWLKAGNRGIPGQTWVKNLRDQLSQSLTFVPREPAKNVRGFGSPVHGSNRFAGNYGGTGISSGGIGMGTGPGSIGGWGKKERDKTPWKPEDPRNLPMSTGKKRR